MLAFSPQAKADAGFFRAILARPERLAGVEHEMWSRLNKYTSIIGDIGPEPDPSLRLDRTVTAMRKPSSTGGRVRVGVHQGRLCVVIPNTSGVFSHAMAIVRELRGKRDGDAWLVPACIESLEALRELPKLHVEPAAAAACGVGDHDGAITSEPDVDVRPDGDSCYFELSDDLVAQGDLRAKVLACVEMAPGHRYERKRRRPPARPHRFVMPLDEAPPVVKLLKHLGRRISMRVPDNLNALVDELAARRVSAVEQSEASSTDLEIDGLGGELRPFQKALLVYAEHRPTVLCADQQGLGKTIEALAWLHHRNLFPALVICPPSLKLNWQREARKWLPGRSSIILSGTKAEQGRMLFSPDVVIINYDILSAWAELIIELMKPSESWGGFKAAIADECHLVKNFKARRTKAAAKIAAKMPRVMYLTGTPILNRPSEFVQILKHLRVLSDFGGATGFKKRYCLAQETQFGLKDSEDVEKLEPVLRELNRKLRERVMIRRLKVDVLKELPPKQRTIVPIEAPNITEYRKAEEDCIKWLRENVGNRAALRAQGAEVLVRINLLRKLSLTAKLPVLLRWIRDFLESSSKLVFFCHFKEGQHALMDEFGDRAVWTGGTSNAARKQSAVDAFQADPSKRLFVGSIKRDGLGLTLTAASDVGFGEFDWTPAAMEQCEDRCHRIGAVDAVNTWWLADERLFDRYMLAMLQRKDRIVRAATEGEQVTQEGTLAELVAGLIGSPLGD